jgi:hypothetical protein
LLNDSVIGPGAGCVSIFLPRYAEEQEAAESESSGFASVFEDLVDREIEDAGHGGNFATNAFAMADEDGCDKGTGMKVGLADEGTQRGGGTSAAKAGGGIGHD